MAVRMCIAVAALACVVVLARVAVCLAVVACVAGRVMARGRGRVAAAVRVVTLVVLAAFCPHCHPLAIFSRPAWPRNRQPGRTPLRRSW